MTNSSMFEALVFLNISLLAKTVIFTAKIGSSHVYTERVLIANMVQDITKGWISLAQNTGMRPFSNMGAFYQKFNLAGRVFEVLLRKRDYLTQDHRPLMFRKPLVISVVRKRWQLNCAKDLPHGT